MKPVSNKEVLYVGKSFIGVYDESLNVLSRIDLPPTIYKDLEFVDPTALQALLKSYVVAKRISIANVVILLSEDVLYVKNLQKKEIPMEADIKQFTDDIPFDEVLVNFSVLDGSYFLFGASRNFCVTLIQTLEQLGSVVKHVIPVPLIAQSVPNSRQTFDSTVAQSILSMFDRLKQYDLFDIKAELHADQIVEQTKQKDKKDLSKLLIVFGFLIIILFGMVIMQFLGNKNSSPPRPSPTPVRSAQSMVVAPTLSPSVVPTMIVAPPVAKNSVSITIMHTTETASVAAQLKKQLDDDGYTNNKDIALTSIQAQKSLLIWKTSLALQDRVGIQNIIAKVIPQYSVQESGETDQDLTINLVK